MHYKDNGDHKWAKVSIRLIMEKSRSRKILMLLWINSRRILSWKTFQTVIFSIPNKFNDMVVKKIPILWLCRTPKKRIEGKVVGSKPTKWVYKLINIYIYIIKNLTMFHKRKIRPRMLLLLLYGFDFENKHGFRNWILLGWVGLDNLWNLKFAILDFGSVLFMFP